MELNKIYQEPCLDTLKRMPNNYLDCVITSPPYWQLRDYGYDGQWGLEPTFQEYLEHLWEMMDEIWRVLKNDGTVWINLGDTYGGGISGQGGNTSKHTEEKASIKGTKFESGIKKPLNKCLLLIPHRFAIGCIDRGWIIRNDIIWAKRNGMPESTKDRFSKKHDYFFLIVKSEKYFFDLDAIRDKHNAASLERYKYEFSGNKLDADRDKIGTPSGIFENKKGKNPGSVSDFWDIPTKPSSNEHYAAYNDKLLEKPILAGCPIGGIVYDPFMGTGSTAEISLRTNRNYIGSEMSIEYCKIAEQRLNPYKQQISLF